MRHFPFSLHNALLPCFIETKYRGVDQMANVQVSEMTAKISKTHPKISEETFTKIVRQHGNHVQQNFVIESSESGFVDN